MTTLIHVTPMSDGYGTAVQLTKREGSRLVTVGGGIVDYQKNCQVPPPATNDYRARLVAPPFRPGATQRRDGTICAGPSPRTKKPIYVSPSNEKLLMTWDEADEFSHKFKGHGRLPEAFRLASKDEASVIVYRFTKAGVKLPPQCWTSDDYYGCQPGHAWYQDTTDGHRDGAPKNFEFWPLLVRDYSVFRDPS